MGTKKCYRTRSQAAALRSVNANELNLEKQAALLHKATGEAQAEVRAVGTAYGDRRKCWLQLLFQRVGVQSVELLVDPWPMCKAMANRR